MGFTQEEQQYITANKEELKNSLLEDFLYQSIEINSSGALNPDEKLTQINEINASLNNDFKLLEQSGIELDEPSPKLSSLIRQGVEFAHIRDISKNNRSAYDTSPFDYITKQSSSEEEDAKSLTKEQDGEHVEREPRDPSIIIPGGAQNPDEFESLISDEEKENIPSEISDISMSFLLAEEENDELLKSILGSSEVSFEGEALEDPEEEYDRQKKLSSSNYKKEPDVISSEEKLNQEKDLNSAKKMEPIEERRRSSIKQPPMPSIPEDDAPISFDSQGTGQTTEETRRGQTKVDESQVSAREFTTRGERVELPEGSVYFPYTEKLKRNNLADPIITPSQIRGDEVPADNHPTPNVPSESLVYNNNNNQRITEVQTPRETESSNEDSLLSVKSNGATAIGSEIYFNNEGSRFNNEQQPKPGYGKHAAKLSNEKSQLSKLNTANNVPPTAPANNDKEPTFRDFYVKNKDKIVSIIASEIANLREKTNPDKVQSVREEDIDLLGELKDDLEALHNGDFDSISQKAKNIIINHNDNEVIAKEEIPSDTQKNAPSKKIKRPFRNFFKLPTIRKNRKSKKDKSPAKNQQPKYPSAPSESQDTRTEIKRGPNDQTVIKSGYLAWEPKPSPSSQQSSEMFDLRKSVLSLRHFPPVRPKEQTSKKEAENTNDDAVFIPSTEFESTLRSNIIDPHAETILYPGDNQKEQSVERSISDNKPPQPKDKVKKKGFFKFLVPTNKGKKKDGNGKGARKASKRKSEKNKKKSSLF